MASMTSVAESFLAACDTGKGWEGCRAYCAPDATFSAQAEPLLAVVALSPHTAMASPRRGDAIAVMGSGGEDGRDGPQEVVHDERLRQHGARHAQAAPLA